MMDWSEKRTFGRGATCGNPSARTQLFAADRRTSHGSKKDRELEVPTVANRALGLMLILGVAVAQKDHCHQVGHLKMPRAR